MKLFTFGIFACTKHNHSILGVARRGVGWDEIIFVGLETMCHTMILSAHMLDASSQEWIGFLCFFPPNLENKLQGALNERLLKYCVQLYVAILLGN